MTPVLLDEQALRRAIARAVRDACVQAAQEQCENARTDGLCWEGAWEAAMAALRSLDLEPIITSSEHASTVQR